MKKVILITGASRGIGRNMAIELAKEGNIVIANYNNSEKQAISFKNENKNIEIYKADVSKAEEVKNMFKFIIEKYGKIDVLINNAGIYKFNFIQDISEEEWDSIINTNLKSVFLCSKEAIKNMIIKNEGCIINISSVDGLVGQACEVHYCASKAGIDGITKALAKEVGANNIRVNSIAPGAIKTDINNAISEEDWKIVIEETPLKKIGKQQDITKCVKWLIEDEFTTGQIISINGGWVIN